jgi:hypothetical protein
MVTHSSTSRPVQCLCMAERTGCPVFTDLWSYVFIIPTIATMLLADYYHCTSISHRKWYICMESNNEIRCKWYLNMSTHSV